MLFPLIAAGAGILALLALTGKKAAPSTGIAPTPPPPPTPGAPAMPANLKAQFDDLLANGLNADGLEVVATQMETFGFTNEGAALRARAAQIRAAQATQAAQAAVPIPSAPPPFVPGVLDGQQTPGPTQAPTASPPISFEFPADASLPGVSVSIPVVPPPAPSPAAQQARVTTSDPAPSGDLIMRTAPDPSAAQVPGGGAEKDGIVTILNANASADGIWSEILWPGGSRRPAARGFAKKKYLVALAPSPAVSGIVIGAVGTRYAKCVAPSGCRLRVAPSTAATFRALVGNGETVQVLNHAQGTKADFGSPGPGGWAQVRYKNLTGWLPSEWLMAA